jgi:hypothetical protein
MSSAPRHDLIQASDAASYISGTAINVDGTKSPMM